MANTFIYLGAIIELQFLLNKLDCKNLFLVTGKKSYELCGAKGKIDELVPNQNIIHFNDFNVNPDSNDVIKGIQLLKENNCDLIISIGGGSAIDMAKLINYYHNIDGFNQITEANIKNENPSLLNHICIPTTAGSGSEATHFAVMYIGDTKYSIAHQKLIPNYTIIDPEFHYSQTSYQKAVSGVDALAQAIESLWSVQSTIESRMYSEHALKLVWVNLPKVVNQEDHLAHLNLAIGAHVAGKAINIAKTTAPHALAYGFTKYAGLPHGHAVALSLPFFLKANININSKNCNDPRGPEHVNNVMKKIKCILKLGDKNNTLTELFYNINININRKNLKIDNKTLHIIIENINPQRLANNPIKTDMTEIFELLQ